MKKAAGRDLIDAAEAGDLVRVKASLAADADVHARRDEALRLAAANGHREVVEALLSAGANVHALEDEALRWAAQEGHREVVQVLLAAGADVHAQEDYALCWAAEIGCHEVVALLLEATHTWPADLLAELEAGPCGVEVEAWRARRDLASANASITELAAP